MQTVRVSEDYRILIPAKVRNIVPLKAGDELEVKVEKRSAIKLVPKKSVVEETRGLWISKNDIGDSVNYINKIRAEWDHRIEELNNDSNKKH